MNKTLDKAKGLKELLSNPIAKLISTSRNLLLGFTFLTAANVTAATLDNTREQELKKEKSEYSRIMNSCDSKNNSECENPELSTLLKIDNSFVKSLQVDINELDFTSLNKVVEFGDNKFEVFESSLNGRSIFALKLIGDNLLNGKAIFVPDLRIAKQIVEENLKQLNAQVDETRTNLNLALN